MHKVDRKTLEASIAVRLSLAIRAQQRALGSRRTLEHETAVDAVVAAVIDEIDNKHTCVVQTEMIHGRARPGEFGIDEPWPGEPLPPPPPRPPKMV